MKKWRIEYREKYEPGPLSFWVHKHLDSDIWSEATKFKPSLPKPVPARGYPILIIDALGVELNFSSAEEVEYFLEVIGQKNMPTSTQLTEKRNVSYGPNRHWLSRLPAKLKSWNKRETLIPVVQGGLSELKKAYKSLTPNKQP